MKGVPPDYYRRLSEVDERHWWYLGMRAVEADLLGGRLQNPGQSLLDAGCGVGGFLAWAAGLGIFDRLCGLDVSPEAIELARARVPEADLRLGSVSDLPFEDGAFDLAVLHDVLQHVHEDDVQAGLGELLRVLKPSAALLVRTNGARRAQREREDWRTYDSRTLAAQLEQGGFRIERITYANMLLALYAVARGRSPRAPTERSAGVPKPGSSATSRAGAAILGLERRYLSLPRARLPFGHTLLAVAVPRSKGDWGRKVAAFFDDQSVSYDSAYDSPGGGGRVARARLQAVVCLVGSGPGRVLDAGMGGGRLCAELDRRGWTVAGIDSSAKMVELARGRLPEAAGCLQQGRLEALPFESQSFDAFTASGVLEYVEELPKVLAEAHRVLVPGGRAVVTFPNYTSLPSRWRGGVWYPAVRRVKRLVPLGRPAPMQARHPLSRARFEAELPRAGFEVEAVEVVGFPPPFRASARRLRGRRLEPAGLFGAQLVFAVRRSD